MTVPLLKKAEDGPEAYLVYILYVCFLTKAICQTIEPYSWKRIICG